MPEPPPLPRERQWHVEVGVDTGISVRPADDHGVHAQPGFTIGGHARVRVVRWLAVRALGRTESSPYVYDDGALGLPPGTHIAQPSPVRVYLSVDLEPTWSPIDRFELWAGAGIGWGRTLAPTLHTSGAETVTVAERAAVLVEVPLSFGFRYEIIPGWLNAGLLQTISFPFDQAGQLLESYSTPGKDGTLRTVEGFPHFRTSFMTLAGIGLLL